MKLEGKSAVVTGAGRGIGRAIALTLAEEGAKVVVNYAVNAEAAEQTVEAIKTAGGEALAVQADVSVPEEAEALIKAAQAQFGSVDILVNNAGITRDRLILRMSVEEWDAVINTNLRGTFLCCKAVMPIYLKQKGGIIVNVSSVLGKAGGAGQSNYSASKAGLFGLTKSLAKEMGGRGVRVNAVAPGFIETDMTAILQGEHRETLRKQIPMGRFGAPEDIARVVAFLCSNDAAYIQGETITVDGGLFM